MHPKHSSTKNLSFSGPKRYISPSIFGSHLKVIFHVLFCSETTCKASVSNNFVAYDSLICTMYLTLSILLRKEAFIQHSIRPSSFSWFPSFAISEVHELLESLGISIRFASPRILIYDLLRKVAHPTNVQE